MTPATKDTKLRRAIIIVAALNLAYFFVESGAAVRHRSVSLFADCIDFLEDATLNILVLFALRWSVQARGRVAVLLAALLLVPSGMAIWSLINHLQTHIVPNGEGMGLVGTGALAVNLFCAFYLLRFRDHAGSLTKAAFLSARNDAAANVAIVVAGVATRIWPSPWPDLGVGLLILCMNADAVGKVLRTAREEQQPAAS